MKNRIKLLTTAAVLLATFSFGIHRADAFVNDGSPQQGRYLKKMAAKLGLSAEQKQEIKGIIKKERPAVQPILQQLVTERRALRALIQAPTVDEPAIRAQAAKVATVEADMAVQRARTAHEIRAILSPEQIEKYLAFQKERDLKRDKFLSRIANRPKED